MRKKTVIILMVLGCILLVAAFSLFAYNQYEDKKAEEAAAAALEEMTDYLNGLEQTTHDPYKLTLKTFAGYEYVGMLDIPSANLRLPVLAETDDFRLCLSSCRYSGSPKTDNMVIAGHNFDSHFGRVANLSPGEEVIFIDMDGVKYEYEVASLEVLAPTEVSPMVNSAYPLTLFTCTYDIQNRVAVRCVEKE